MFESNCSQILRRINKAGKYATDKSVRLRVPKLDLTMLRVVEFSDSSFVNNPELSPQLDPIVFLADASNNVAPISFRSRK